MRIVTLRQAVTLLIKNRTTALYQVHKKAKVFFTIEQPVINTHSMNDFLAWTIKNKLLSVTNQKERKIALRVIVKVGTSLEVLTFFFPSLLYSHSVQLKSRLSIDDHNDSEGSGEDISPHQMVTRAYSQVQTNGLTARTPNNTGHLSRPSESITILFMQLTNYLS